MPRHHRSAKPKASQSPAPRQSRGVRPVGEAQANDLLLPGAFLGLSLNQEIPWKELLERIGDPTWRDEGHPPSGAGWGRWGWEPYDPDAPEGGLGPRGLVLEVHQGPDGKGHLSGLEVGARFQVQPLVGGHDLADEEGVLGALPGHLDEGHLVTSHLHRLVLWRHPAEAGFRTASWLWSDPKDDEASSRSAWAGVAQWRDGRGLPWPWSSAPHAPNRRIVLPARVLALRPGTEGSLVCTVALAEGMLAHQEDQHALPQVELGLRQGASAERIRPGDWSLLHGLVVGAVEGHLVLDRLAWHALLGDGQGWVDWGWGPCPGSG